MLDGRQFLSHRALLYPEGWTGLIRSSFVDAVSIADAKGQRACPAAYSVPAFDRLIQSHD